MVQSPYTFKTMAKTTPMTAAMEMYNWLCDKIAQKRDKNQKVKNKEDNEVKFNSLKN